MWNIYLYKGQTFVNLRRERFDVLLFCMILCISICRRQFFSHGCLSAVRARRKVWSVELIMCHECHMALVDITQ